MKRNMLYIVAALLGASLASCADLGFGVDIDSGGIDPYFYGNGYYGGYYGSPGWSVSPGYIWQPSAPPLVGNGPGSIWNPQPNRPAPPPSNPAPVRPPQIQRPQGAGMVTGSPIIPNRPGNNGMPSTTVGPSRPRRAAE